MPLSIRQGLRLGNQDNVTVPNTSAALNSTVSSVTIDMWVTMSQLSVSEQTIVSRNGPYAIQIGAFNKIRFSLYGALSWAALTSNTTVTTGQTVRITATYDGAFMTLYVNGVFDSSMAKTGNLSAYSVLYFGYPPPVGYNQPFYGQIHAIRIYNRAISASEISGNVARDGLVGEWLFQESQGTTAYDTSGNGNNGTINGATWVIKKAQSVKPATKPKKNMIPPFTDSRWSLHENTRMKQANFVGKVSGSVVENPHKAYGSYLGDYTIVTPSGNPGAELTQGPYNQIISLNGSSANFNAQATANGSNGRHLFSFNIIEHVLRNYGADVFGSAVTAADRAVWVRANIAKLTCNWYGYGSGPAGNKATIQAWATSNVWAGNVKSHTNATVTQLSSPVTAVSSYILNDGFAHFIAYADASDGVTASTIFTDFVELEVVMAKGSIPQPDYSLTLSVTADIQGGNVDVPALPNTNYIFSMLEKTANAVIGAQYLDANGSLIIGQGTPIGGWDTATNAGGQFTTPNGTVKIRARFYNKGVTSGTFTFTNLQLEQGSVATDFEPYIPVPDNKPAVKPKKNMLKTSDYTVNGAAKTFASDFTTGLVQGGMYTLSGMFAIYADDDTTNERVSIQFNYADGTTTSNNNGINAQIRDGVERFISVSLTANPAKFLTQVRVWLFDYSTNGTKMHRTARQVQLEQGPLTTFEPYIPLPDNKRLPIAADSFNRADNASSLGNADTGQAWTAASGTWGIRGGEAYCVSDTNSNLAWVDAGTIKFIASMDGSGQYITQWRYPTLLLHYIDAGNYIFTRLDSGNAALVKRQGGVNTVLFTGPFSLTNGQTYNHKVVANEGRFDFYVDGVLRGSYTLTPAESNLFLQSTKVGIRLTVSGTPTFNADFDNFLIERL